MRYLTQFSQKEIELYEKYQGVSLEQEFQDAFNIGYEIGVQRARRELAENFLDIWDNETIAIRIKLSIEEVVKLREGYHVD